MNQTGRLTEVTVPHLAESLVSATIGKWLKKPGDYIEQYDVLCELFTEKVNTEMPSPIEGKLIKIIVGDGETAAVGEAICVIEEPAGSSAATSAAPVAFTDAANVTEDTDQSMRGRFSPAVHRLAQDNRVDLSRVAGTGLGGRITRKDVETFIASGNAAPAAVQGAPAATVAALAPVVAEEPVNQPVRSSGIHLSASPQTPLSEAEGHNLDVRNEHFIDVTPMRNAIATKMRQSVTEIPHAWTMIEVDVTNLVVLRNKVKDEFMRREGINLTYLAFMLKAVVNAIKDYPIINSVWAVDKIIVKRDINISLSVGTEDSVMTPVIKKADQKNIAGLAREIDELTKKTRAGKLALTDMVGGTFTVNNTGSFGSILSYPIINYPQAAIVTFESIVKKPVVIQDMIAVRSMVNLCLSLDHRILDGVICGRFLQRVKENLESYNADTKIY
ncbi:dihydrolipoamide acetyltransferase family protein [Paenibacillus qinlingensis]|uniref:dihydrolipoamide acetyltransferase family protein n=1 Tax=Paenibacillus qinlingensis TaxID=1837343 RepID=UPI0015654DC4|nr:dihydrolipoamide acetyltransferase family protein [Paenibacillus qinlingensis]NQX58925.1 2-oxo acid dehydrogenase subunit E2 [Paenibacillus qinlingensis]